MLGDLFGGNEDEDFAIDGLLPSNSVNSIKKQLTKPLPAKLSSGFVGLENQGATCYLNSLIQAMYMTPELRNGLFMIDPEELGISMVKDETQEGAFEIDERVLEDLLSMGVFESHGRRALIATKNGSMDQIFDFLLKNANTPEFQAAILPTEQENAAAAKRKKRKPRHIPLELQYLFSLLKMADRQAVSTQELTTKGFEWQGMDGQVQHDAHELNRLLIDAIEQSLKRTSGQKLLETLYMGKVVNSIRCKTCGNISEREESFYDCNMQVIGCKSLVESLRQYCAAEVLEGDSAYQCDVCGKKQSALRSTVLRSVPLILTFSCNRFRIDQSTQWQRVKVTSRQEFPLVIDMNSFVESSRSGGIDINGEIRADPAEEEAIISQLNERTVSLSHAVLTAEKWAEIIYDNLSLSIPKGTDKFPLKEKEIEIDVATLTEIEKDMYGNLSPSGEMVYKLHAVIMHRGSAYSGHYFAFIRDSEKEGNWELPQLEKMVVSKREKVDVAKPSTEESSKPSDSANEVIQDHPQALSVEKSVPTSALLQENEMYFLDESKKKFHVNRDSPMGTVVVALVMQSSKIRNRNGETLSSTTNSPSKLPQSNQHAIDGSVFKWGSIPISVLGREVLQIAGNTWANLYKPLYGTIEAFIRQHDKIFEIRDNEKNSRNPYIDLSRQAVREIFLCSGEKFKKSFVTLPSTSIVVGAKKEDIKVDGLSLLAEKKTATEEGEFLADFALTEDEALARALQESFNEEEPPTSPIEEDSWQVAGSKKKEKKPAVAKKALKPTAGGMRIKPVQIATNNVATRNPNSNSAVSSADIHVSIIEESKEDTTIKADVESKSEILRLIKNVILNKYFGPFFNFNDSVVTSMEVSSLDAAFSGTDSAYLLVYRRENIQENRGLVAPPLYWQQKVNQLNEALAKERSDYDACNLAMKLQVRCPSHFRLDTPPSPLLKQADNQGLTIEIDGRQTVQDFLDAFLNSNIEELDGLGLGFCKHKDGGLLVDSIHLHSLAFHSKMDGFQVTKQLERSTTMGEALKDGENVLLWNGWTIAESKVAVGPGANPIALSVFQIELGGTSSNSKSTSFAEVRQRISPLILPYALSLNDLSSILSSRFQLKNGTFCINMLVNIAVLNQITGKKNSSSVTEQKKSGTLGEKRKQMAVLNLVERGSFSNVAKSFLFPFLTTSKGKSYMDFCVGEFVELLKTKKAVSFTLEEDRNGSDLELWVEDIESRGFYSQSAAEIFVSQWNNAVSVEILLYFDPSIARKKPGDDTTSPEIETGKDFNADEDFFSRNETVFGRIKVEVSIFATVWELKLKALAAFNLDNPELCENTFLKSVKMIEEENLRVIDCGVGEGSQLSLCLKEKASEDQSAVGQKEIKLKIVLIGNLQVGGVNMTRVHLKETIVEVPKETSIAALRDLAGVLLLDYPSQWTSMVTKGVAVAGDGGNDDSNVKPMRLRKATWMGEAGELLVETRFVEGSGGLSGASTGSGSEAAANSVESAGLKEGDILLLEEGFPPIKGAALLKVHIWQPQNFVEEPVASLTDATTASGISSGSAGPAWEYMETALAKRKRCLPLLGELSAAAGDTLDDLYSRLHDLLIQIPEYSSLLLSQILIRELRSDFLPGKCHWASFHATAADSSTTAANKKVVVAQDMNSMLKDIGVAAKAKPAQGQTENIKSNSQQTLKKAGLMGDRSLVLEVIPLAADGTVKPKPPPGAFRIWLQLLKNPGCKEGEAEMEPKWPPLQVVVNGGSAPTLGHLRRSIAQTREDLQNAPLEKIAVFKFNPQTVAWTQMVPETKANNRKAENITQSPYFVKEGDQFCAFLDGSAGRQQYVVVRAEDLSLRALKEEEKRRKEESNRAKASRHSVSFFEDVNNTKNSADGIRPVRKEALLMIGKGGQFSDDDDDFDEHS